MNGWMTFANVASVSRKEQVPRGYRYLPCSTSDPPICSYLRLIVCLAAGGKGSERDGHRASSPERKPCSSRALEEALVT